MQAIDRRELNFVRLLLKAKTTKLSDDELCRISHAGKSASLSPGACARLVSDGLLERDGSTLRCTVLARSWLRRHMSATDNAFAEQHQIKRPTSPGPTVNLNESPLASLGGARFLKPHQIEAGERFRRLFERANLRARTTMSYNVEQTANSHQNVSANDLSDMAVDARRQIDVICTRLPLDCRAAVLDVCGFEKGLQIIEVERGWPRRSAKLVLRIGLEQLAAHFGLTQIATGNGRKDVAGWMGDGARPTTLG